MLDFGQFRGELGKVCRADQREPFICECKVAASFGKELKLYDGAGDAILSVVKVLRKATATTAECNAAAEMRDMTIQSSSQIEPIGQQNQTKTGAVLTGEIAPLLPRFVRFRSAPAFFGMNKNHFNQVIRPRLTAIRIGQQGLAFDRLEMEAAAEEYIRRNGVPVAHSERSKPLWESRRRQDLPEEGSTGTSTSSSEERAFAKALERAICGKRRSTLPSD